MKDIDLPITQTFSLQIDPGKIDHSKAVHNGDGTYMIPLGNLVNDEKSKIVETARRNGGKILYATTSIEQQIESILLLYFMGDFVGPDDKREIFERDILQSSALSYSAKKELISKVINATDSLPGKSKNKLQSYLKNIMEWRNAFAHGKIKYDSKRGCFIAYYSGSVKNLDLTDEYWDTVVSTFRECRELLKNALNKIKAGRA